MPKIRSMNTSFFRHEGSTRGFGTTDPERQGVLPSASRLAAMQAVQVHVQRVSASVVPLSATRATLSQRSQARPAGQ
jgi:hypothetical protein